MGGAIRGEVRCEALSMDRSPLYLRGGKRAEKPSAVQPGASL